MHVAPSAGVELMQVPIAPLGAYFPQMRTLVGSSPQQVLVEQTRWLDPESLDRCQQVWAKLTPKPPPKTRWKLGPVFVRTTRKSLSPLPVWQACLRVMCRVTS